MEYSQAQQLGYVGSTMALSLLNILNVENIEATYQQILDGNIDWYLFHLMLVCEFIGSLGFH